MRLAHEAEIEDITGIFDQLDALFVAANLLPKYGPEETNIASVVDRQIGVETAIQEMSSSIHALQSSRVQNEMAAITGIDDGRDARQA